MSLTGTLGAHAEKLALKYLQGQGLSLISQNYHCRFGEIDLILQDGEYLVFVEVRYRKNKHFGGALASITSSKQLKLKRSAEYYLITQKKTDFPCRFDILCVDGNLNQAAIDWLPNAF